MMRLRGDVYARAIVNFRVSGFGLDGVREIQLGLKAWDGSIFYTWVLVFMATWRLSFTSKLLKKGGSKAERHTKTSPTKESP